MSAIEEAIEALESANGSTWCCRDCAKEDLAVVFAALPPSIVVDGRVVEVTAINHGFDSDRCPWFYDGCNCHDAIAQILDAAREVAGKEEEK